uniref:Phosphoglycerate mutase-like protein n=1 Tax=Grammatophora oceanica TaxID=210454 RepID=A0A7S1V0P2_9STRA
MCSCLLSHLVFCLSSPTLPSASPSSITMSQDLAAHSQASLELAKRESAEHLHGMKELYDSMRDKPLIIKAYALDDTSAPTGDNVKTVHFVRHGQGFHNLMADIASSAGRQWTQFKVTPENPYVMPEILDAPLTEKGRQQARLLQPVVQAFDHQPELVAFSPNCRALQTGLIAFGHLVGEDIPFVAHEMAREENGVHVCDKRRPTSQQAAEFPQVDFSLLESEEDIIFRDDRRETKQEVGARIYKFFEWLETREEKHVGVNSHSGWLLTVFNGICECDEKLKGWFQTGEMRSVKLEFVRKDQC